MSSGQELTYVSWLIYVVIFVSVLVKAIRVPSRSHTDITLFFGATTFIILQGTVSNLLGLRPQEWLSDLVASALMALPYLLLRLLGGFTSVLPWVNSAAAGGLALSVVVLFALGPQVPPPVTLVLVAYFVVLAGYVAVGFIREAGRARGVTRRRLQAVALGTGFIGLNIFMAGLSVPFPEQRGTWTLVSQVSGLLSGIAYFLGFAPPTWLRRSWQEAELRAFLGKAPTLTRLPDTRSIVQELEWGAATSVGAPYASIGLWDPHTSKLRYYDAGRGGELAERLQTPGPESGFELKAGVWEAELHAYPPAGQAFATQKPVFVADVGKLNPAGTLYYEAFGSRAALAAPITAGDKKLGVLIVHSPKAPVFAVSDLELVQLLADQAAVILESRALIDEAARVRALEEATRLKDDFLSSAAHDLKTPLTGIIMLAQLMLRRAQRDETAPADQASLHRLIDEAQRLRALVMDLLDVARLERGALVGAREQLDLADVVRSVCSRPGRERCVVHAPEPAVGELDRTRIEQLLENLVENALKYGAEDQVVVRLERRNEHALISVRDNGIGIPAEDMPFLFERFHRGRNVDDRRFAGMGLGLYICRGIVEGHGGRIWAESDGPGTGSTFCVELPLHVASGEEPVKATPEVVRV